MSTPNLPDDPFGFAQTTRDKIRSIQPTPAPPVPNLQKVDEVGDKVGFVSRERQTEAGPAFADPRPATTTRKPSVAINMRVPLDIANPFVEFCRMERYSYPEGLEEIMKRAGILRP